MGKMYHENTKQDEDGADIWVSEKDLRAMEVSRRWEISSWRQADSQCVCTWWQLQATWCTLTGGRGASPAIVGVPALSEQQLVELFTESARTEELTGSLQDRFLGDTSPSSKRTAHVLSKYARNTHQDRPYVTCIATEATNLEC